jgi:cytoskeletal protein CcmA (bactofilin family)
MAEREGTIDSFIGDKSRLEGTLSFNGTLTVLGKFKGKIKGGEGVVLGEGSESEAEVEAGHVVIHGNMVGKIKAEKRVEIHRRAQIEADVVTPNLIVHDGALFEGRCSMKKRSGQQRHAKTVDLKDGWLLTE